MLVACLGNIFQGDDAFGCEVAKLLLRRPIASDVRIVDFGIRGLDLSYALLDEPELTILVDALRRGEKPGTIYTLEPDLAALKNPPAVNAHVMDPLRALSAAKAMGARFGRILLVGCEPADLGGEDGHLGLSAFVENALENAAALVEQLIEKERATAEMVRGGPP